jgi:sarcosine oxidase
VSRVDVAVVGAGIMGTATARSLAAAGRTVILIDQLPLGHDRGSSHGSSRIFRLSYPEQRWVTMAVQALEEWRALEAQTGTTLLALHGGLDIGSEVPLHQDALEAGGAAWERLDGALSDRFGLLRVEDGTPVLFHPDAGITLADRAWEAMSRAAVAAGAELYEGVAVQRLRTRGETVEIDCGGSTLAADVAVVTAGGWAAPLLATAGIDLDVTVTRETVAFFGLPDGPPPSVVEWGSPAMYALDAPGFGGHVLKAGEHHGGPVVDPGRPGGPDPASVARIADWVRRRCPGADPEPVEAQACLYTSTSDHDFVLRRHGRIVVGSPCSGHGFKFAPLIGRRLADLVTGGSRGKGSGSSASN